MEEHNDGFTRALVHSRSTHWDEPFCQLPEQMRKPELQISSRQSVRPDAGIAWHNADMVQNRLPPSSVEDLQIGYGRRDKHIHTQA
jgi:hypothetical protein